MHGQKTPDADMGLLTNKIAAAIELGEREYTNISQVISYLYATDESLSSRFISAQQANNLFRKKTPNEEKDQLLGRLKTLYPLKQRQIIFAAVAASWQACVEESKYSSQEALIQKTQEQLDKCQKAKTKISRIELLNALNSPTATEKEKDFVLQSYSAIGQTQTTSSATSLIKEYIADGMNLEGLYSAFGITSDNEESLEAFAETVIDASLDMDNVETITASNQNPYLSCHYSLNIPQNFPVDTSSQPNLQPEQATVASLLYLARNCTPPPKNIEEACALLVIHAPAYQSYTVEEVLNQMVDYQHSGGSIKVLKNWLAPPAPKNKGLHFSQQVLQKAKDFANVGIKMPLTEIINQIRQEEEVKITESYARNSLYQERGLAPINLYELSLSTDIKINGRKRTEVLAELSEGFYIDFASEQSAINQALQNGLTTEQILENILGITKNKGLAKQELKIHITHLQNRYFLPEQLPTTDNSLTSLENSDVFLSIQSQIAAGLSPAEIKAELPQAEISESVFNYIHQKASENMTEQSFEEERIYALI